MNSNVPQSIPFTSPHIIPARPPSSAGIHPHNPALTPLPGYPGMGITMPLSTISRPTVDLDPITPGIQNTPGIVTATGPSRLIHPGNMGTVYEQRFLQMGNNESIDTSLSGFMIGGNLSNIQRGQVGGIISGPLSLLEGGVDRRVDVGPVNYGQSIQLVQPSPVVIQQTQIIQTQIITPVIPNVPQEISFTTPPVIVNQSNFLNPNPMIQGDTVAIQNYSKSMCNSKLCIWGIVGLVVFGLIMGGLYFAFRPRDRRYEQAIIEQHDFNRRNNNPIDEDSDHNPHISCPSGQYNSFGRCIKCPSGTVWNGTNCILLSSSNNNPIFPLPNDPSFSSFNDPNNNRYRRTETINTSWNGGNNEGRAMNEGLSGSTAKVINSVAELKRVVVQPLVEDPINHMNRDSN